MAVVLPRGGVVGALDGVPAREQAVEVLGVEELVADERGRVRVGQHVLSEVELVGEDVVDDPAEERDVGSRPQRHVDVGQRAGAGEPRVDVDHLCAAALRLDHPLEADRVALGHVRTLDDDHVGVLQVLLERGRAAATE